MPDTTRRVGKTIKQGRDLRDGSCTVCVLAMATGETLEAVYEFLNDGRQVGDPVCMAEAAMFLMSRGLVLGAGFGVKSKRFQISDELAHNLKGWPAFVVVSSGCENEYWQHAIYYDGRYLRDPDPFKGATSKWEDYEVQLIFPLAIISDKWRCERMMLAPQPTPDYVLDWRNGEYGNTYGPDADASPQQGVAK